MLQAPVSDNNFQDLRKVNVVYALRDSEDLKSLNKRLVQRRVLI